MRVSVLYLQIGSVMIAFRRRLRDPVTYSCWRRRHVLVGTGFGVGAAPDRSEPGDERRHHGHADRVWYVGLHGGSHERDLTAERELVITVVGNQAPTADAGVDQSVADADGSGDEAVTLDGSGSSDSDGTIVTYAWAEGVTPLGTGMSITPTLTVGTHTVTLTVTDDGGAGATDTVEVIVNAATLTITTATLPDGVENVDYGTQSLAATAPSRGSLPWDRGRCRPV